MGWRRGESTEANVGTPTATEKKKNRTFKKFSYRGVDLDQSVYCHCQILFLEKVRGLMLGYVGGT